MNNITDKERSDIVCRIADELKMIRHRIKWDVEDVIFKIVGNKISQDERLLLADKIISECINMPMSISDHYGDICATIERILRSS